jgi:hypothetical protein
MRDLRRESGHWRCTNQCLLRANSGHLGHKRTWSDLFNDLVCKREQRRRESYAERFGGLEVEDQLDLGRLLDRKVRRLDASENSASENADPMIGVGEAIAVAH